MISCAEAVEQLWGYLEREVSRDAREAVEQHLAFCRRCCGEVEFAQELRGMLVAAARVELPVEVEEQLIGVLDGLETGTYDPEQQPPSAPSTEGTP